MGPVILRGSSQRVLCFPCEEFFLERGDRGMFWGFPQPAWRRGVSGSRFDVPAASFEGPQ